MVVQILMPFYKDWSKLEIGWGGISKVEELTGMSHSTINKGIEELKSTRKRCSV